MRGSSSESSTPLAHTGCRQAYSSACNTAPMLLTHARCISASHGHTQRRAALQRLPDVLVIRRLRLRPAACVAVQATLATQGARACWLPRPPRPSDAAAAAAAAPKTFPCLHVAAGELLQPSRDVCQQLSSFDEELFEVCARHTPAPPASSGGRLHTCNPAQCNAAATHAAQQQQQCRSSSSAGALSPSLTLAAAAARAHATALARPA